MAVPPVLEKIFSPLNVKQGHAYRKPKQTLSADGAITLIDGIVELSKSSAGAYTLAAPNVNNDGALLIVTATTAQAHVVTVSGGVNGGGTGTDVCTFGGAKGDGMMLVAIGGVWYTGYLRNVTPA